MILFVYFHERKISLCWSAFKMHPDAFVGFWASKWHMKRIVLTKDELFICNVGEDIVRDIIFLAEIDGIEEVNDKFEALPRISSFKKKMQLQGRSSSLSDLKTILVCTSTDSYNSGRQYYLQPDSDDSFASLVLELRQLTKEASKRAKGQAVFQRSQAAVKRALDSAAAQAFTAFLIVAVRPSYDSFSFPSSHKSPRWHSTHLILFAELLSSTHRCTAADRVGFRCSHGPLKSAPCRAVVAPRASSTEPPAPSHLLSSAHAQA